MFKKIYIEITNVCNLDCKFCPNTNRDKQFMSLENFEEIIKKVKDYSKIICLHVKGEPLLHPNLEQVLKILEKYGLQTNITTNGTLIKDSLETLKNSKSVRQINFSLHSITQNENLSKTYLEDIFKSAESLKDIIISYRIWDDSNSLKIISSIEEHYKIQNLVEELKHKDYFKLRENLFINKDNEFTWPNINSERIIEKGRCLALKEQIAILVDGSVVPCCLDNNGDIVLGNIFEETLENILRKAKTLTIKKNFENSIITCDLCKTCGFLRKLEDKRRP